MNSPFTVPPNGPCAAEIGDDRVDLAVMIAAARRIPDEDIPMPTKIVCVGAAQEEIGLRGAPKSVALTRPDLDISVETRVAADYPAVGPTKAHLARGPGIFLSDSSMVPNRKLRKFSIDIAAAEDDSAADVEGPRRCPDTYNTRQPHHRPGVHGKTPS